MFYANITSITLCLLQNYSTKEMVFRNWFAQLDVGFIDEDDEHSLYHKLIYSSACCTIMFRVHQYDITLAFFYKGKGKTWFLLFLGFYKSPFFNHGSLRDDAWFCAVKLSWVLERRSWHILREWVGSNFHLASWWWLSEPVPIFFTLRPISVLVSNDLFWLYYSLLLSSWNIGSITILRHGSRFGLLQITLLWAQVTNVLVVWLCILRVYAYNWQLLRVKDRITNLQSTGHKRLEKKESPKRDA